VVAGLIQIALQSLLLMHSVTHVSARLTTVTPYGQFPSYLLTRCIQPFISSVLCLENARSSANAPWLAYIWT